MASEVPRLECFPIERVEPALRAKAEALLLETMDSPALYTVIGGLKPMTSSFLSSLSGTQAGALTYAKSELQPGGAVLAKIDELRRTMAVLRCGDDIQSAVLTEIDMSTGSAERGAAEPFVFHVPAVRNVIAGFPGYFARLAITPQTSPETMLFTMHRIDASGPAPANLEARREWMRATGFETIDQIRASGALYGYARPAVEAFAESINRIARGEKPPGPGIDDARMIMRIPSFKGETNWYRKATPEESPEDAALRVKAGQILAEYRTRREKYIGAGKPGVVAMLRDWFCARDQCSAANAQPK